MPISNLSKFNIIELDFEGNKIIVTLGRIYQILENCYAKS